MTETHNEVIDLYNFLPEYCRDFKRRFSRPANLLTLRYQDILGSVRFHDDVYSKGDVEPVPVLLSDMRKYVYKYALTANRFDTIHESVATLLLLKLNPDFFQGLEMVSTWTQQALALSLRIPYNNASRIYRHFDDDFNEIIQEINSSPRS